jgi:hypothetical protein
MPSPEGATINTSTGVLTLDLGVQAVTRVNFFTRATLISFGLALTSGCASTSAVFSLSSSDNLDTWRTASNSQQALLCENLSSWLAEPVSSPSGLCSCISTTADNGGYDFMTVLEVADVCAGLLKDN